MIRKIIKIDSLRCDGCGLCAQACHEGAIGIVDGKAVLLREDYCDGLGDCLPACPCGAISFEMREAPAYDEIAVLAAKVKKVPQAEISTCTELEAMAPGQRNFPIQIKLVPDNAAFPEDCHLLIAADCCAYFCEAFHSEILGTKTLLIGCPKLDGDSYALKLSRLFAAHSIRSITVVRMTVPCCGGMTYAVRKGLELACREIPVTVLNVSQSGEIRKEA